MVSPAQTVQIIHISFIHNVTPPKRQLIILTPTTHCQGEDRIMSLTSRTYLQKEESSFLHQGHTAKDKAHHSHIKDTPPGIWDTSFLHQGHTSRGRIHHAHIKEREND